MDDDLEEQNALLRAELARLRGELLKSQMRCADLMERDLRRGNYVTHDDRCQFQDVFTECPCGFDPVLARIMEG